MSVHIGVSISKHGIAVLWQKVKGEKIQVKALPVRQFASWGFDERLLDRTSVVVGCEIQSATYPCSAWQMLESASLRTIFFDGDGEVLPEGDSGWCDAEDDEA